MYYLPTLTGGLRFEICTDDHFIIRHNPFLRLLRWMRSWLPAPRRAAPSMPAQQQRAMRAERVELEDDESTRTGQDEAGDEDIRVRRRGKARPISWASSSLGGWGDGSTMRVGVGVGVGIGMGPMSGGGKPTVCYLNMKNLPIPFGAIFFQYMLLWKRLSAHYLSLYVLRCLLYGEPIRPIPKLQVCPIELWFLAWKSFHYSHPLPRLHSIPCSPRPGTKSLFFLRASSPSPVLSYLIHIAHVFQAVVDEFLAIPASELCH
ncbi:hypothetical protein BC937DRAFT_92042 [Endogone sp. FLAS-F59071]|nr:hypothetical protein BC937DRAFT_92042 [Endogone sp. FLAS-F59071]|eukprot:RUS15752.1 hypothetical protein BC937DRAFT_92042 [Endogone sp. FLAS-F59071]